MLCIRSLVFFLCPDRGKEYEEIMAQWYDREYWLELQQQIPQIDALIADFNEKVGLI